MTSWPSRNEECPTERAVRQHLQRQGLWNKSLDHSEADGDGSTDAHVDDREFFLSQVGPGTSGNLRLRRKR